MLRWSLCAENFHSRRRKTILEPNVKIEFLSVVAKELKEWKLQQAGVELEKIVVQSLRQAPPAQAPLMAWPVVCGSAVAERTRALNYADGVLRVAVPDAGWKSELQGLAPRYLAVINRYTVGIVRRIEFVITEIDGGNSNNR